MLRVRVPVTNTGQRAGTEGGSAQGGPVPGGPVAGQLLLAAESLGVSRERPRRRGFKSVPPVQV